jgi:glycosyltransferase involved in cell wall biosynthesis
MDDIKEAYCKGKIFFAPMTIGSGLQNKLLEAMSLEIPCITSELANKSLNGSHNENILIGNSTDEYISHIRNCLDNEKLRNSIGKKGKEYIVSNFNWQDANQNLLNIFHSQQSENHDNIR